jgi:hypothetical protein
MMNGWNGKLPDYEAGINTCRSRIDKKTGIVIYKYGFPTLCLAFEL